MTVLATIAIDTTDFELGETLSGFEIPQGCSLTELAEELDISRQAFSRRLSTLLTATVFADIIPY
jgi:DNA-binding Lrp family transcriptional regulator